MRGPGGYFSRSDQGNPLWKADISFKNWITRRRQPCKVLGGRTFQIQRLLSFPRFSPKSRHWSEKFWEEVEPRTGTYLPLLSRPLGQGAQDTGQCEKEGRPALQLSPRPHARRGQPRMRLLRCSWARELRGCLCSHKNPRKVFALLIALTWVGMGRQESEGLLNLYRCSDVLILSFQERNLIWNSLIFNLHCQTISTNY